MPATRDGKTWRSQFYYEDWQDMRHKKNKRGFKTKAYFKKKKMCEIKTSDIRAWQNELIKQGYAPTYLKSINNQLAALFNYAVRYYDMKDNPCRKAGSIG